MIQLILAALLFCASAWAEPGHSGSVSISTTAIGPSGSLLIKAEGANDKISVTTGNFGKVSATHFYGDGSALTGVLAITPTWAGLPDKPLVLQNISNSTGSVTATSFAGNISGTLGYFKNVSASSIATGGLLQAVNVSASGGVSITGNLSAAKLIGDCSLCANTPAPSALSYYALTAIPTVLQNISNSTGSVSVTTINALSGVFANLGWTSTLSGNDLVANGQSNLGAVSTTGLVSNSATFSNYMREGVLAITASTPTTFIPLNAATMISVTLTSNTTISFTNVNYKQGNVAVLKLGEDATGGRTVTWPANARYNGNTSPSLVTTANTFNQCTATPVVGSVNILIGCPAMGVSN